MAELLVKAVDFTHPDPDTDKAASYKRGDVVVIGEDGSPWSALEILAPNAGGKFFIVELPGTSVAQILAMTKSETQTVPVPSGTEDALGSPTMDEIITRRAWGLDISQLPPGIITALDTPGGTNIPLATLLNATIRKSDGVRADTVM